MCDQNAFLRLLAAAQASQPTAPTPSRNGRSNGASGVGGQSGMPADMLLWQSLLAAQAQAQIMAFQQMQQQQQQQQQQGLGEIFRQLTEMTNKNADKKDPSRQPSTSSATATIKEGAELRLEAGEIPKSTAKTVQHQTSPKPTLDPTMWQMLAVQMLQQQHALNKANGMAKKHENGVLDLSAAVNRAPKVEPSTSSDGADTRSTATPNDAAEHNKKRPPATESQVKIPLQLGWRRQTCIRAIAASGVRGDVVYYAPCGKKLSSYAEVIRYLMKNPCPSITRDNFSFSSKMLVGEFIQPRDGEDGEKIITKLTEEEVADQVSLLISQKPPPKNGERKTKEIQRAPTPEEIHDLYDLADNSKAHDDEEKSKWSREPVDDLTLTEIRPMPELTRIGGLSLNGEGFADALMIFEFCQNFADVLSIDRSTLPTLEDFVSGLEGSREHQDKVLHLTKVLFGLALEYPGLPSGKKGHTKLGQSLADVGMSRENYSELMRQFLSSRCSQGQKLAELLEEKHFEELEGEKKASILAFFCNELLCCRNIVREIDNNLEEIGKLKGERWLRDGKARALKGHQKRKKKEEKTHHEEDGEAENSDSDGGSRTGSPQPMNNKKLTPGLGQVEILTHEEEVMTVEELDEVISQLNMESDELKDQINGLNSRVRSFPFGWDRYHRQYWQLPHVPTVLVESIESSGSHNPACNATEVCSKDPKPYETPSYTDPDVLACVEDLVDEVVMSRIAPEKRKRKKIRRIDNSCKRGWWTVENREQLEAVRGSLHGRGIRERCLHRLLCKGWFLKDIRLTSYHLPSVSDSMTSKEMTKFSIDNVRDAISSLEHRICDAQLGPQGWTPSPATFASEESEIWDYSHCAEGPSQSLEELKQRLFDCEALVERRYLRQNFYAGATPTVAQVLGLPVKEEDESESKDEVMDEIKDEIKEELKEEDDEAEKEAEEDRRELSDRWRSYIHEAKNPGQLMLAVQCLDSSIAWERSITESKCQICQTSENAPDLLLCDGCEMGYHMQCFKPAMGGIPEGKWYCPRCREGAGGKPICVLCQKEGAPIYPCRKCHNFLHIECSGQHTPDLPSEYFCPACEPKNFARRVILRGESEERGELEEQVETEVKDFRRAAKRKADPLAPVIFPVQMNMDLCRTMLDELETQPSVGPFLEPVDLDLVPGYKELIKSPIDISTIRNKVDCMCYETPDDFAADLDLMFNNCRTFNEDDSPVGIAGQTLQKFFMKRWRQVKYNYSKRLRRLRPSQP